MLISLLVYPEEFRRIEGKSFFLPHKYKYNSLQILKVGKCTVLGDYIIFHSYLKNNPFHTQCQIKHLQRRFPELLTHWRLWDFFGFPIILKQQMPAWIVSSSYSLHLESREVWESSKRNLLRDRPTHLILCHQFLLRTNYGTPKHSDWTKLV